MVRFVSRYDARIRGASAPPPDFCFRVKAEAASVMPSPGTQRKARRLRRRRCAIGAFQFNSSVCKGRDFPAGACGICHQAVFSPTPRPSRPSPSPSGASGMQANAAFAFTRKQQSPSCLGLGLAIFARFEARLGARHCVGALAVARKQRLVGCPRCRDPWV
jgi:hypothetical protein